MIRKAYPLVVCCVVTLAPALVQAQVVKGGSIMVKVEVEIEGVLEAKGDGFSILVAEREFEQGTLTPKFMDTAWQLDFSSAKELQPLAKVLVGKKVIVQGKSLLYGIITTTGESNIFPIPIGPAQPGVPLPPKVQYSSASRFNLEPRVTVTSLTVPAPPAGADKKPVAPPGAGYSKLPALPAAPEGKPGEPKPGPPKLPGVELKKGKNLLPILKAGTKDDDAAAARKKLETAKVSASEEALKIGFEYKIKNAGGILAEEGLELAGLFAAGEDLIWVVIFPTFHAHLQGNFYEVWVRASTGEAWRPAPSKFSGLFEK